ncbi:hypothetical protein GE300_12340 [Rhodobacteraceae bacterium 2CG4]|uniref:Uncharacterized protein n=1 Tax=Halovulum marinum TaxID=2662447 RepID=A0A6L5Z1G0_9RHOB|nr:hypothetical protein [Halovulum marinum]MSU90396.1 hypothetical protein [Halovulum marinum]
MTSAPARRAVGSRPPTPPPARRAWPALALACLAAAPLAAQDAAAPRAWIVALERCIAPLEDVAVPDLSDVGRPQALPDWLRPPAGAETWAMGEGIYLSLSGAAPDELTACTVDARADIVAVAAAFEAWAQQAIAEGRYRRVPGDAPAVLDSTLWREPRLNIHFEADPAAGTVRIRALEINAEA